MLVVSALYHSSVLKHI